MLIRADIAAPTMSARARLAAESWLHGCAVDLAARVCQLGGPGAPSTTYAAGSRGRRRMRLRQSLGPPRKCVKAACPQHCGSCTSDMLVRQLWQGLISHLFYAWTLLRSL